MKESLEKEDASELSGSAASKVGPGRIVGKSRIFYGWWICLGGALIMAMSSGINFHGFSNGYDNETDAWISWQLEKMKK